MKTPWRFVADLVSRKPKVETTEPSRHETDEVKALGYSPVVDEPVPGAGTVISELPTTAQPIDENEHQASPAAVPAEQPAVEKDTTPVLIDTTKVTEEAIVSPSVIVSSDTELAGAASDVAEAVAEKKSRSRREPTAADAHELTDSQSVPAISATFERPKTFIEEMAALDAEVEDLRRQLAKKLVEQNAHLRKMLARFEQH